jgi:hypothetical protein
MTVRDIVEKFPMGSTVYMLASSWQAVQQKVALFGDFSPRHGGIHVGQ